jgi:hypothetical protein
MTLFTELKRRKVFRVAAACAVVAWMVDAGYLAVMNLKMNFLADPRLEAGRVRDVLSTVHGY